MRISVPFVVPVQVFVDTETGTVDRVVVIDEAVTHDESDSAYWENLDDLSSPVKTPEADAALALAETVDWPAWEHGF